MPSLPIRPAALMLALVVHPCPAQQAVSQDALDEARRSLRQQLDAEALGAAYAAMASVTTAPEISAATYRIRDDSAAEPTMRLYKLPLAQPIGGQDRDWKPYIHANLGLMRYGTELDIVGEAVDVRWTAYGGAVGLGARRPSGHWTGLVQAGIGIVHIENHARYRGVVGQTLLAPLLKGLLFDWRANATKLSLTLGGDYQRTFEPWQLEVRSRISTARVETFSSSSDFIDFDATGTVATLRSDASRAIAIRIAGRPTRVHLSLGATAHLGQSRDALGFDRFVEAGGGVELDFGAASTAVESVKFGVLAIYGPDVVGWSLSMGLGF
ncbi:MAG: hypothetical protein KDH17_22055 [Rhodocyclaceae bacterium]|nr:hypothetical protein [Rhodocyclaceae bacterium]